MKKIALFTFGAVLSGAIASADTTDLPDNLEAVQIALDNLFEDKACTILKSNIALLSDEELETNEDYTSLPSVVQEIVLKVKNDTWDYQTGNSTLTDSYDHFFRIAEYKPYSHYQKMAGKGYATQSVSFGKLSGPTGLFVNRGDVLYIFVAQDPSADCTLQAELVTTEDTPGDHPTGTTFDLCAGLNVITCTDLQDVVYIFYQLNNPDKYLEAYPDIKIHIEGGTVNGYWDATRDMTDLEWAEMKDYGLLSACPVLNLKTERLVFAMGSQPVLSAVEAAHQSTGDDAEDIALLMRIWDMICSNEDSYQSLEHLEGRMRNVWNVFSMNHDYMYTTTYGTYYVESALSNIMNYYAMTHITEGNEGEPMWGPSHEIGHCHQDLITVIGTTECAANVFANINQFEQGVSTTRFYSPSHNFDTYLANGTSWLDRDEDDMTPMFFQLYLYFHAMGNDTNFLPKLFRALRADPLSKGSWNGNLTADTDGDGVIDVRGGYKSYGKYDYLHFAKKACDAAEADLSEFFEAWGMFVPENNKCHSNFGDCFVTTTQADIDEAREYMRQYTKKLGNIMFIDDHIEKKLANPDNKFEAVPASDGYKVNCRTVNGIKVGTAGETGDFEQFDGHSAYDINNNYYTLAGNTLTFHGSGMVGHKVYDMKGNLLWATNMMTVTLPTALRSLFPDGVVVVGAEQNMEDVPCPYFRNGSSPVYRMLVTFPDGVENYWWANTNIDAYLPANTIAVVVTDGAPKAVTSSVNVVDTDGTAHSMVIDGDLECHIPQDISAQSLRFTKAGDGFQALSLPFAMHNATTIRGTDYVQDTDVAAGEPLVINGVADISLSGVALSAGDYTSADSGNILTEDGGAVVAAEGISPFVYLFDTTFELGNIDGVNEILSTPNAADNTVYDLSGRRLTKVTKPGVYIVNGVKTFLR